MKSKNPCARGETDWRQWSDDRVTVSHGNNGTFRQFLLWRIHLQWSNYLRKSTRQSGRPETLSQLCNLLGFDLGLSPRLHWTVIESSAECHQNSHFTKLLCGVSYCGAASEATAYSTGVPRGCQFQSLAAPLPIHFPVNVPSPAGTLASINPSRSLELLTASYWRGDWGPKRSSS